MLTWDPLVSPYHENQVGEGCRADTDENILSNLISDSFSLLVLFFHIIFHLSQCREFSSIPATTTRFEYVCCVFYAQRIFHHNLDFINFIVLHAWITSAVRERESAAASTKPGKRSRGNFIRIFQHFFFCSVWYLCLWCLRIAETFSRRCGVEFVWEWGEREKLNCLHLLWIKHSEGGVFALFLWLDSVCVEVITIIRQKLRWNEIDFRETHHHPLRSKLQWHTNFNGWKLY